MYFVRTGVSLGFLRGGRANGLLVRVEIMLKKKQKKKKKVMNKKTKEEKIVVFVEECFWHSLKG